MEVVKEPNRNPVLYRLECGCGTVVECQRSELRHEPDHRDGHAWVLKCPQCNAESWFSHAAMEQRRLMSRPMYSSAVFLGKTAPIPYSIIFFSNGNVACCDSRGQQIPRYQGEDWEKNLREDGYDWRKIPDILGNPNRT